MRSYMQRISEKNTRIWRMKEQNIDNLTSLWRLASGPFGAYRKSGSFNIVELAFSEWPNRIWLDGDDGNFSAKAIKNTLRQCPAKLTFTKFNAIACDEHQEANDLGLILKSVQTGMSLNLQNYKAQPLNSSLILDKVNNEEKAAVWSDVFRPCFNYFISPRIVEAIKDEVAYYLLRDKLNTVGCAATFIKDNQIGIHSLGVLDSYRKKGFAEAAMHIILQEAKNNGLVNAHLQASMFGFGIYKRIGFVELFKMCNYRI